MNQRTIQAALEELERDCEWVIEVTYPKSMVPNNDKHKGRRSFHACGGYGESTHPEYESTGNAFKHATLQKAMQCCDGIRQQLDEWADSGKGETYSVTLSIEWKGSIGSKETVVPDESQPN